MPNKTVDQNPVNLSVILTNLRLKYPQYKDVDNAKLTKSVLGKYPQYRNLLTPHGKMVADVVSGKHDPLGILDPQTSIRALKTKYPDIKDWSDNELLKLVNGKGDGYPYLGERLVEDPTSPLSSQYRPFTSKEISEMPKFLQEQAKTSGLGIAKEAQAKYVARVMGGGTAITIDNPSWFDRGTMAHELSHAYQNTRTREFTSPDADYEHDDKTYDYGGLPGLQQAIKDRKTIANYTVEQQAEIVKHYYDAHRDMMRMGKVNSETAADFEEMKKAYGPFIRQLAGVPTDEDLYKPIGAPPPPGVPGYEATGYISGDPNIMDFAVPVDKKDNTSTRLNSNLPPL